MEFEVCFIIITFHHDYSNITICGAAFQNYLITIVNSLKSNTILTMISCLEVIAITRKHWAALRFYPKYFEYRGNWNLVYEPLVCRNGPWLYAVFLPDKDKAAICLDEEGIHWGGKFAWTAGGSGESIYTGLFFLFGLWYFSSLEMCFISSYKTFSYFLSVTYSFPLPGWLFPHRDHYLLPCLCLVVINSRWTERGDGSAQYFRATHGQRPKRAGFICSLWNSHFLQSSCCCLASYLL